MKLRVSGEFHPTEEKTKLLRALENVFPNLEFKEKNNLLEATGNDLNDLIALKELFKVQTIRDTARAFLEHKVEGDKLSFELNKQAAFMGKINFVDFDIALGTIKVEIKEPGDVINWLTS